MSIRESSRLLHSTKDGKRVQLKSPIAMPKAAAFLWNRKMMLQMNCRGFATAQFMQPEPAKYAYAPNLEAKTFMQPEQPYYAHHPGRFFYIKDEDTGRIVSAPYEPVRAKPDDFTFSVGQHDISWQVSYVGLLIDLQLSLTKDDVVELWSCRITNTSGRPRKLSLYPYFPVGYMSWMNQSGEYREDLGGVVCTCITPYQKVADYFKNKNFKDKTIFLHEQPPYSWEVNQATFEGEGGLTAPSAIINESLNKGDARYEIPAAILQYRIQLNHSDSQEFRFLFGPAFDDEEIARLRQTYLSAPGFSQAKQEYAQYVAIGKGCLSVSTPDSEFDDFVNHWLPRQIFYHGDVNRLTTDPQTRNYLQDGMGMSYINPAITRGVFLRTLSQQETSGAMPDGILLREDAEFKYINQIPHTDHGVWLPICLAAYLNETNDYAVLGEKVPYVDGSKISTVFEHITHAMRWLIAARDERGLSYIGQGDWCDPMNMVGYKGRGVSCWLSVATAYALGLWADICDHVEKSELAAEFRQQAAEINSAVNRHLWDGDWFGRGITDNDVVFGISKDKEGKIFLNPQSWAILSGAAKPAQIAKMLGAVEAQLETPYGTAMLAPAYTAMRDDVGRVTQKFPGSGENGAVYNHAAVFYIFSLYTIGESDRAYRLMRAMLPGPSDEDYLQRGQLPVFIPNYYRGAYYQHPRTAGRSSQLVNTGTVSWIYRCLVEGLFGLRGEGSGLIIDPQLPSSWQHAKVTRVFRDSVFEVEILRDASISTTQVWVDDKLLQKPKIENIKPGTKVKVMVKVPSIKNK